MPRIAVAFLVDPRERFDVASGRGRETPLRLLGEYRSACTAPLPPPEAPVKSLDPAVRAKLKALGYL